jgi:hypothetical protein
MIDRDKAIAAVGDKGVELYERILSNVHKFDSIGSSGRIGGKLSVIYRIKEKGSVYVDIYKNKVDVQLGDRPNRSMSYEECIVELERFLRE